jgi:hypothetical protein
MNIAADVANGDLEGNNDPSSSKKKDNFRCKKFFGTIHDYTDAHISNLNKLSFHTISWLWCKEVCPTTGRPHIHFFLEFKCDRWRDAVKKMIGYDGWCTKAKGKIKDCYIYCVKEQIEYHTDYEPPKEPVTLKILLKKDFKPFQNSIYDILMGDVTDGAIHCVVDPHGQCGKTTLMKYFAFHFKCPFSYGGKCGDVINLVFNNKKYFTETDKAIMIYNFGRDTDMDKISYKSMEQVSDGCISNTKFECGCFIMNCPHILILANNWPNTKKMTGSRWKLYEIVNDELVKRETTRGPGDGLDT